MIYSMCVCVCHKRGANGGRVKDGCQSRWPEAGNPVSLGREKNEGCTRAVRMEGMKQQKRHTEGGINWPRR